MHSPGADSIRLVVQRVSGALAGSVSYRMIAYPKRKGLRFRPILLATRAEVIARMKAAIPNFDDKLIRPESESTQVLFASTFALTNQQLIQLGVAEV